MIRRLIGLAIAVAASACVHAGQVGPNDSVQFAPAFPDEASRAVRFTPFTEIDWQSAATTQAVGFDVDHLTAADAALLRARVDDYDNAEVNFNVALPSQGARELNLITGDGIHRIQVYALQGTVRFEFNRTPGQEISGKTFYGAALARPIADPLVGGLVSWSNQSPSRIDGSTAALETSDGQLRLHYTDPQTSAYTPLPGRWFDRVVTAYGFTLSGRRFLFVVWPADTACFEACCASNFQIYAVTRSLESVASNSYDCDP